MSQTDHNAVPAAEGGGLGLNCSSEGLSLAGVPLLRITPVGLAPRSAGDLAELMRSAYGHDVDLVKLSSGLDVIAKALNSGDLGRAMVAAVRLRLPELNWDRAARVASAETRLAKFNPAELRDWLGRWTTGGGSKPAKSPKPARVAPKANLRSTPIRLPGSLPMRLAIGEEIAGGGPEDPVADLAAIATLGVGALVTALTPHPNNPTTAGSGSSGQSQAKPQNPFEEECDDLYKRELINCQIVAATKGNTRGARCAAVASTRFAECLRFGPNNISTPFYWGN